MNRRKVFPTLCSQFFVFIEVLLMNIKVLVCLLACCCGKFESLLHIYFRVVSGQVISRVPAVCDKYMAELTNCLWKKSGIFSNWLKRLKWRIISAVYLWQWNTLHSNTHIMTMQELFYSVSQFTYCLHIYCIEPGSPSVLWMQICSLRKEAQCHCQNLSTAAGP